MECFCLLGVSVASGFRFAAAPGGRQGSDLHFRQLPFVVDDVFLGAPVHWPSGREIPGLN